MSIKNYTEIEKETVLEIAKKMAVAAKTAPKARGIDNLEIQIVTGESIQKIAETMHKQAEKYDVGFFHRDAENILQAPAMLLIGTRYEPIGLNYCGLCGFGNCENKRKHPEAPCAFNTGDMGIAVGSAVSIAADNRVDNRIMYTVGMAAKELGIMGENIKIIYGIPLSASNKNPFFDRKPHK
jgi:uncharacterized ferredoxin-like protein